MGDLPTLAAGSGSMPAEAAKEHFLLKAEIQQLKCRLAAESSEDQLKALRSDCNVLRTENEKLRVDVARLERVSVDLRRSVEEAETLRNEVSTLRLQEQHFQERLRQNTELEDTD